MIVTAPFLFLTCNKTEVVMEYQVSIMSCLMGPAQGGTCHVCIRGCACHVFGSKISIESHIFGPKICKHELPTFWGARIFSNCHFLSVQLCNTSKIVPCYQIYDQNKIVSHICRITIFLGAKFTVIPILGFEFDPPYAHPRILI